MLRVIVVIAALFMVIKPVIPVLDYVVNYDYIKNELCVNKDKPQLHCNGKCHLAKELGKASEQGKPQSNDKKENYHLESEILFYQNLRTFQFLAFIKTSLKEDNFYYSDTYQFTFSDKAFHPPIV
ncbi:hypothetical protein NHF50_10505 [Flavobacterium sp. NRK F10]|uniref:hypothetical protein n=1 Tax=Flavobacterium sp. NRK F10 TaxID=2954931 RepID=UPI0020919977|nr:hypothetical protein [Flavobacterium sp. NRK F10]MCO6175474.1 hypothetical protein [Flavobacterium sp. NRK F10]